MLAKEVIILVAEDDEGHASLIVKNLRRAGISNEIVRFKNGREVVDFLAKPVGAGSCGSDGNYILLLDISMPVMSGVEVLRWLKENVELAKIPVTMLTTTDDPREVEECYKLGCSNYIAKPVDYSKFVEVIRQLGLFLMVVEVPRIKVA
ncbi:response regulator [Chloroflexota bacterium]